MAQSKFSLSWPNPVKLKERPNLGFESEYAWWWWEDRYLGIEINDVRF